MKAIPGPMPNFGPFATVDEAILAACPVIMSQPHAVIPVSRTDQNFGVYWRISQEYCAWLYAPRDGEVEMSLLAVSPAQDNPSERHCALPAWVEDGRYARDKIIHLVILHNHTFDDPLSKKDYVFLVQMGQLHGFTPTLKGQPISLSVVAFFGSEHDGKATCSGFYRYLPARKSELVKATRDDRTGAWTERVLGHLRWNEDGTYELLP